MLAKSIENVMIFVEVINAGGFTAAADKIGVSKGYVSQRVSALEKELDVQLLLRSTRRIRMTSAGEALYKQAPKINDFWYDTQTKIQATKEEASGKLRITAPTSMSEYLIGPHLETFLELYPKISIELETGNVLIDQVQSGFDIAIRITETPPEHLIARELIRVQYFCCATPEYLDKNGEPKSPDELNEHECLALSTWDTWRFFDAKKSYRINVKCRLNSNHNNVLKHRALNSKGIIRLPHYTIEEELREGKLVPILKDFQHEQKPVYLLYPPMNNRPQKSQACIDFLLKVFNSRNVLG